MTGFLHFGAMMSGVIAVVGDVLRRLVPALPPAPLEVRGKPPRRRVRPSRSDDWVYRINVPKALRHRGRREALRVMRGEVRP